MADQLHVDELAREKVSEIENLLKSGEVRPASQLETWFTVLKQIITAADLHRSQDQAKNVNDARNLTNSSRDINESIYADYSDDNEQFNAVDLTEQFASNPVKWTIRVQAFRLVHQIVELHSLKSSLKSLPDLIRLAFVSATSPYDHLKIEGFKMFKFLINRFAYTEEKEFPGHSILEQYRTQVISALKPAFNLDAPPYITAIASQVCCQWLCMDLEKESSSLKPLYNLMLASIEKLENQSRNLNSKLYTESELEQERLDILGSWAQLYIKSEEFHEISAISSSTNESKKAGNQHAFHSAARYLKDLVTPQIALLVDKWWEALKDYALLIIPTPKIKDKTHDNDHVYTREVALAQFSPVWPKLVMACSLWLTSGRESSSEKPGETNLKDKSCDINDNDNSKNNQDCNLRKYFRFLLGIFMKEFCSVSQSGALQESTVYSIRSLTLLAKNQVIRSCLSDEFILLCELHSILYSLLSGCTKPRTSHRVLVWNLLESTFQLLIEKIESEPKIIRYAIAQLCSNTSSDLKNFESIADQDELKTKISISISYTLKLMRLPLLVVAKDTELLEAIIMNFKCILENEVLALNFIEMLNSHYVISSAEQRSLFIEPLFKAKIKQIEEITTSLSKESKDTSVIRLKALLNIYVRSIISDVKLAEHLDCREKIIITFMTTMISVLPKEQTESSQDKELTSLCISIIDDFERTFGSEVKHAIASQDQLRAHLEQVRRFQDKSKSDKGNLDISVHKKAASKKNTAIANPKVKIVLKGDFSNFYSKKP